MIGRPLLESRARRRWMSLAAALLALGLAVPAAANAAAGEGPLSAELEALAAPAVAAQPVPQQAEAVGLPAEGPGSLSREGGRVVVEARFDGGAASDLEALREAGARILVADPAYQTVALSIEPEDLGALAEVPGLGSVTSALRPVVHGTEEAFGAAAASEAPCEGGSVISQGVAQLNVPAARTAFGARGAGITVGVISDSYNSATSGIEGAPLATRAGNDEASDDLPGAANGCAGQQVPVNVIAEAPASPEDTDEGRAMLQVVHDVAPEAQLAFATALPSELAFARNIERLAEPVAAGGAGATVIVDDIGYLSEPFYQDGPVAVAIQKVTAAGVTYLTAAGNENLRDALGRSIGSWEAAAYRPVACPSLVVKALGATADACMNFKPSGTPADPTFGMRVEKGAGVEIDLQWAEAWFGVKTDLDAYLFNPEGKILSDYEAGEGDLDSTEVQKPIEVLGWENETGAAQEVLLVINRCSGTCNPKATAGTPRLKFEFVGHGGGVSQIEYPTSSGTDIVGPTIYGHAAAAAAISVGAVNYAESSTAPREPEPYSSRGPATHYFGPVLGATAAAPLGQPEVLAKPDLTATDCASTTFFARLVGGSWRFCGTSEAAPHAAAVAALMKEVSPLASPGTIAAAMRATATQYTPASAANAPEAVGAGLLNAASALAAVPPSPPQAEAPSSPAAVAAASGANASAPAPTITLTKKPSPVTNEPRPKFEFRASESPVTFTCQLDGGAPRPCASPFVTAVALREGHHRFVVDGTDAAGRSGSSGVYAFTVDTRAPTTTFARKPKPLLRTGGKGAVAHFRLRASESPVTFYCQVDKEPARTCGVTFHRRFGPGPHLVKVRARDAAGNLAQWTDYRFRVKLLRPGRPPRPR